MEVDINQLKNKLLEKIANVYTRPNNEQTELTFKDTTLSETKKNQYSSKSQQHNNSGKVRNEKASVRDNVAMDNDKNEPHEDLKREENKLLEKSIIKANREAIRRLRMQRIQLLKDCMLPTNSEDENEEFDIEKMDRDWQEETNRTTLVLETIYDNLRMKDATDTFKNTSIIKNRDVEPQYRVTTIVMTEKLTNQADDNVQIQGTFKIKNKQWKIQHQYGEEGQNVNECRK